MGQKLISSVERRAGSTGAVRTVGYGACIPMRCSEGRTVLGDGIGWALCCRQTLPEMDQRPTLSGLHKGAAIGKEKGKITSENPGSEIAYFGSTVLLANSITKFVSLRVVSRMSGRLSACVLPLTLRTYIHPRVRRANPGEASVEIAQPEASSIISSTPKT